jgi:haloalkane dehalogenase
MFRQFTTRHSVALALAMSTAITALALSVARADEIVRPEAGAPAYAGYPYAAHYARLPSGPRVHYLDEGEGEVPLLLVHGIPTQAYVWREVIPHLAQSQRVIAIDQPNWGYSDHTPDVRGGVPCAGHYADWIGEFVDTLGLEKVRLVLFDMGFTGFLYAARNPDEVAGIAFFETVLGPLPRDRVPPFIEAVLSEEGVALSTEANFFTETLLFNNAFNGAEPLPFRTMTRDLEDAEAAVYHRARPTPAHRQAELFDRECLGFVGARESDPGTPAQKAQNLAEFTEFATYLATTDTPRLAIFGNPGLVMPAMLQGIVTGTVPPEQGGWQSTETVSVAHMSAPTLHYWPEERNGAPEELAGHILEWIARGH